MENKTCTPVLKQNPVHPYYITRRYTGQRNARDIVAQLIRAHGEQR